MHDVRWRGVGAYLTLLQRAAIWQAATRMPQVSQADSDEMKYQDGEEGCS